MDFYSYYLKHCYNWLNCIYVPSDNEFVSQKSYGTPLKHMIQENVQSSRSSSSSSSGVRVSSSSSGSSSSSSISSS